MTTPPNAPDVLPLPKWHEELVGMMPGKGLYEHQQEWVKYEDASAAVAELLTREAALVAEVAGLREDIADRKRVIECKNIDIRERDASLHGWAERAKKAEAERDALAAKVGALRLDALRYRFAREVNLLTWPEIRAGFELGDQHLDAAIDKARAEAGHV